VKNIPDTLRELEVNESAYIEVPEGEHYQKTMNKVTYTLAKGRVAKDLKEKKFSQQVLTAVGAIGCVNILVKVTRVE